MSFSAMMPRSGEKQDTLWPISLSFKARVYVQVSLPARRARVLFPKRIFNGFISKFFVPVNFSARSEGPKPSLLADKLELDVCRVLDRRVLRLRTDDVERS